MKEIYTLEGVDSNAFSVMAYVTNCMKKENKPSVEIENYRTLVMSSCYNDLLTESIEILYNLNNGDNL